MPGLVYRKKFRRQNTYQSFIAREGYYFTFLSIDQENRLIECAHLPVDRQLILTYKIPKGKEQRPPKPLVSHLLIKKIWPFQEFILLINVWQGRVPELALRT
jgi:hypothetical protein